ANYEHNTVDIVIEKKNDDGEFEEYSSEELEEVEWENTGITSTAAFPFTEDDGTYRMHVTSVDKAGNKASEKISTFTIDRENPETFITGVEDGEHYNDKEKAVSAKVKDENIDQSRTTLEVNKWDEKENEFVDADIETGLDFDGNLATWEHDFSDEDTYEIVLNATDKAGRSGITQRVVFTIDRTDPVVLMDKIKDGEYYDQKRVVTFEVDERNYRENNVEFKVVKDGTDITENIEGDGKWRNKAKVSSLTYTFADNGDYEVTFASKDKAGNESDVIKRKFTIDTSPPSIKVDGVEDGEHYDGDRDVEISI